MAKGSDREAAGFAKELKWFLWNEVWYATNSCRAWSYSGERHSKMLQRAAEDKRRSKEHEAAVDKKQACSGRTMKHLKVLAQAAGNEVSRAVLTNGRLTGEFATAPGLQEENAQMRGEIGERAWEDLVLTLRALAEHATASLVGDKLVSKHKEDFDKFSERLRSIYLHAFDASTGNGDSTLLAVEVEKLDQRETRIWTETGRLFRPKRTPEGVGRGRVSIVTPTVERRQSFHKILFNCFQAQDWPDKELIVVETYQNSPSAFLTEMAKKEPHRLTHVTYQRAAGDDWSIGLKRNIGASLATGEFIASFDDDDLYAPTYLTTMVECMKKGNALGVTLSSWHVFDTASNAVGYANPRIEANMRWMDDDVTEENIRKWVYGYGFSYVYRRQAALDVPYDSIDLGEDYQFYSELLRRHGDQCIALLEDKFGIALHTQHRANTARDYALWKVPPENISDLDFSDFYPVFEWYQHLCLRSQRATGNDIFEFTFTRSAPRRFREVTVHLPDEIVKVSCTAGALGSDLLDALREQHGRRLPKGHRVFRLPPSTEGTTPEQERWLQKVVRWVSPIAPPLRQLMLQSSQNEETHRTLLARVRGALGPDDRVGIRTTDLWVSRSSEH
uniref:Glycosyltransferase 2-like domain-containing protein n=1 Tax=Alexandrium monilatum TaxID=311494 RepID=A0A7S4SPP5_9DINO